MTSEQPQPTSRLRQLYCETRRLLPHEREEFLSKACAGDAKLQLQVRQLLGTTVSEGDGLLDVAMRAVARSRSALSDTEIDSWIEEIVRQPSLSDNRAELPLPQIAGFEILEVLGVGGMGVVYRARQAPPLSREVALKMIKPGMDTSQILARFRREQEALAAVSHPNIARVLEAGCTSLGQPYFVMELARGQAIDKYCAQHSSSISEKLNLFLELCVAVQHAHASGIIHRDLNPSNVLVCEVDGQPTVKVIDFGVAKALFNVAEEQTRVTQFAQLVGTPTYMSPEQVAIEPTCIDARSDVFAMGVLLYKLLTGETPLDPRELKKAEIAEVRSIIRERLPVRPSRRAKTAAIPRDLDWIVLKALEKSPDRRYQTVNAFADDIHRQLNGRPIQARPPSRIYQWSRTTARYRRQFAITASLLLVGTLLGAWSVYQYRQDILVKSSTFEDEGRMRQMRDSLDLAEAAKVVQMFTALNEGYFSRIRDTQLPRELDGSFLSTPGWRPVAGTSPPSLREMLTTLAAPEPIRNFAHDGPVWDIELSPDGKMLATACEDGYFRLWDLATGEVSHILGPSKMAATAVAFSPNGKVFVTGDQDGIVSFYSFPSLKLTSQTDEREGGIESLAWSFDGEVLAAGVRYDHVAIFDQEGQEQQRLYQEEPVPPRFESLVFKPGTHHLVVARKAGGLDVWDLELRKVIARYETFPQGNFSREPTTEFRMFGENRQWIISGEKNSPWLELHDVNSGKYVREMEMGMVSPHAIKESPDQRFLAVTYDDGKLCMVRTDASAVGSHPNEVVKVEWLLHSKGSAVTDVCWNNNQLFTAGQDGNVYNWRKNQLLPFDRRELQGIGFASIDQDEVVAERILEDDSLEFYIGRLQEDQSLTNDGVFELLTRLPNQHRYALALYGRSHQLAISTSHNISIWDTATKAKLIDIPSVKWPGHFLNWSADGRRLCVVEKLLNAAWVRVLESNDHWKTYQLLCEFSVPELHLPSHLGNDSLITYERNVETKAYEVCWYNLDGGRVRTLEVPRSRNFAISFDECLLAVATDVAIEVFDVNLGDRIARFSDVLNPWCLQFSDDDRLLISCHLNGSVHAWHLPTQTRIGQLKFLSARPDLSGVDFELARLGDSSGFVFGLLSKGNPVSARNQYFLITLGQNRLPQQAQ